MFNNLKQLEKELVLQKLETKRLVCELKLVHKKLIKQNDEKENRAAELFVANKELVFQNNEKEKRAQELVIANKELIFQNNEKEKRAAELVIANRELVYQNDEKEKRAAELRIANYARSLIEASRDPLFTICPKGKITDMNNASIKVIGLSREKLIGTDFINYFTEPAKAKKGYQKVFKDGFVSDYSLTITDHKLTDVLFNGSVYNDEKGDVLGIVVVARDITDQKCIENKLNEAKNFAENAKLKAENATQIAEDAVKAKQQFLSNMSHEIRTPMNAIIGFTKVLLKTDLSLKQREYLGAIKSSGDTLIVLINDILDLAKVDSGKMTFEKVPFNLAISFASMLQLFDTKIQEKNLELISEYDIKIPKTLLGDVVRLNQIIINLVSNAIKFTNKGKITVSAQLIEENEKTCAIEFAVKDTGIGIEKDKISSIFENFQQASSNTSRLFGGTGLGLAIAKQLVENQLGILKVSSVINQGSIFSFMLNFQKTSIDNILKVDMDEVESEFINIKVLVVEDIVLNQLLMKTLLDDFGFERDVASNGKIAIDMLQNKLYDIVLMDLQMPEMNGFEATDYIRNKMNSKIPIIALTADVTTVDLAKCKSVGMNDYLAKPIDEHLLYEKILSLVKKPNKLKKHKEQNIEIKTVKCTNLDYLKKLTKSNSKLMNEMIELYLEQTPSLIDVIKQSFENKDSELIYAAIHKMIPSFSIMGIGKEIEELAINIQKISKNKEDLTLMKDLILKLENICNQSCIELKNEIT
jgi:PAS domain S-box-containing protein